MRENYIIKVVMQQKEFLGVLWQGDCSIFFSGSRLTFPHVATRCGLASYTPLSKFFDQSTNRGVTLYDTIHHPIGWRSGLISRADSLLQTKSFLHVKWWADGRGALQSITANDEQSSHHARSTSERKTRRWRETVVELRGTQPHQPPALVSGQ